MSEFAIRELEQYFDEIGCRYKSLPGDRIYTGLQCKVPFYRLGIPVQITADPHWVTVRGVIQNTVPPNRVPTILAYLAELNAQLRMVRCTIAAGTVVMQADLMRSRCRLENVLEMIVAILRYAAACTLELSVLINNEFVATTYMKLQKKKYAACSKVVLDVEQVFDFDISANLLVR